MGKNICSVLLLFLILLTGCSGNDVLKGNGKIEMKFQDLETSQYDLKVEKINFEKNLIPRLIVTYASNPDATKIVIKSDENIVNEIIINIIDNQIIISSMTKSIIETDKFELYLSCNIKDIELNGNYELNLEPGQSQGSNIILNGNYFGEINSGGSVNTASNITIQGNGKLELLIKGYLDNFNCIYNGNVNITSAYLIDNVSITFNGYGKFIGRITTLLNVNINGEGYVYYYDDYIPTQITSNINGDGEIKKVNT